MRKTIHYYTSCFVCFNSEKDRVERIDNDQVEVVSQREYHNRYSEAGIASTPSHIKVRIIYH